jgi:multidrug resistance efflux pump
MDVKSPLEGVVTYLPNYSQGWMNAQPFKVGDHASSGQAVAEIPDLNTLEMESKLDEVDRGRIALGDAVLVHVDAFPEKTFEAKLIAVSPLTEQSFNEWPPTRSFRAYARIAGQDPRLRPGMHSGCYQHSGQGPFHRAWQAGRLRKKQERVRTDHSTREG